MAEKYKLFPKDEKHIEGVMIKCVEDHLAYIAVSGDVRMGFITGLMHEHLYNPDIVCLSEMFWWVQEEYRGTRAGSMLLNKFVEYGKEHCDWVSLALETNSPVDPKHLVKRGFKHLETNYLLEV
jgi:hypothetical protein